MTACSYSQQRQCMCSTAVEYESFNYPLEKNIGLTVKLRDSARLFLQIHSTIWKSFPNGEWFGKAPGKEDSTFIVQKIFSYKTHITIIEYGSI